MSLGYYSRVIGPTQLTFTVNASGVATGVAIDSSVSGTGYLAGDIITSSDLPGVTGLPSELEVTVLTVNTNGSLATVSLTNGGTGGTSGTVSALRAAGGTETGTGGTSTDYFNHNLYEAGGNISEYVNGIGAGNQHNQPADQTNSVDPRGVTGNRPTVTTYRTADALQKKVQARTINGPSGPGTVTVYAEPTIVNSFGSVNTRAAVAGTVVGNTLRAEDINDQVRCEAAGFVWAQVTKVTGLRESYGACRNKTGAEVSGSGITSTNCPVGYIANTGATGCVVMTTGNVTNDTTGVSNGYTQVENCKAIGGVWNYVSDACAVNSPTLYSVTGVVQLAPTGTNFGMGQVEYAKYLCRVNGYVWNKSTNACEADNSASLVTKDTCVDAGYVWIAGTCYNPNLFGDGMSRIPDATSASQPIYDNIPA